MSDNVVTLTATDFDQFIAQTDKPVLVDFWAEWCGPCKMLSPTLEQLAAQMSGQLTVAKVNVEDSQSLAVKYGVQSIPYLVLIKGGHLVAQQVGVLSIADLVQFVQPHL